MSYHWDWSHNLTNTVLTISKSGYESWLPHLLSWASQFKLFNISDCASRFLIRGDLCIREEWKGPEILGYNVQCSFLKGMIFMSFVPCCIQWCAEVSLHKLTRFDSVHLLPTLHSETIC